MSSLLIHHANLLSFHQGFQKGNDSLLIEEGRIEAIGRYEEFHSLMQNGIAQLDANGKTLMPGFNDTHIHVWKLGNLKTFMLDLRSAESLEHMLSLLSDFHKRFPEARWIVARGFNEAGWKTPVLPTKDDLNRVSGEKPIYVIHTSAHTAIANAKAMELASVDANTKVPPGGEMQIGEDGTPNGIFSETALGLISNHIPAYSKKELKTMILAAREEMYSYGITAATDPAVDPYLMEVYHDLNRDHELGFRLNAISILLPDGSEEPFPVPEYFESPFLNLNTVKFFSDGGLSSHTAALKRPYKNSADHGILRLKKLQYLDLCRKSMEKGLGVATHAIGDAAIEWVVDVYKNLNTSFPGLIKRIEHLGLPADENLRDMAENQIAASMQTIFLHELGRNFIKYLDEDYLNQCYPVKSVLQNGILMALSSDAPVVKDFNPLKGAEVAVTRRDREGNLIAPQEAITIGQSLRAYTADAARISRMKNYGTLEPGKMADLIILNGDPTDVPVTQLHEIKVEKTFIDGMMVYNRVVT
jgi:predicted amidohydrolase YtcJ